MASISHQQQELSHQEFSEGELALIVSGVADNFRIDGRSCFDLRRTYIKTGIFPNCSGSARVTSKNCNLTVGVKVAVERPSTDEPNCGTVEINVGCSATAGRGEDITQGIASVLTNALVPAIDRKSLCISEGHKVWVIYVDVLVLEFSCVSQLIDLSALGVKAALCDTRVPRLIADEEDANDFLLSPDLDEYYPIDAVKLPILLTLTRIHDQYVADVTKEEAAAGIARLTLAFDAHQRLSYTKKSGSGSLHPDPLKGVLAKASKLATKVHEDFWRQVEVH